MQGHTPLPKYLILYVAKRGRTAEDTSNFRVPSPAMPSQLPARLCRASPSIASGFRVSFAGKRRLVPPFWTIWRQNENGNRLRENNTVPVV